MNNFNIKYFVLKFTYFENLHSLKYLLRDNNIYPRGY